MNFTPVQVVQADYGYNLLFTCQNTDGTPFSLANNLGVFFRVQKLNKTALKFSGAMTVVSPTAGTCYYAVQQGDFDGSGIYLAQIQATFSSEVVTFPNIQVTSIAKLPA